MVVVELERILPGPPAAVWELVTDWERQGDWMLEASDFRVVSQHREGVGVEAEATIRIAGISTRDRVRVVAWEPLEHLAVEHLGWVKGRGDLWLSEQPAEQAARPSASTHLRWREAFQPPLGVLGSLGMRLFRPLLVRTFRTDLDALERLVAERA